MPSISHKKCIQKGLLDIHLGTRIDIKELVDNIFFGGLMIKNLKIRKTVEFTKELNDQIDFVNEQNNLNFTQVLNLFKKIY